MSTLQAPDPVKLIVGMFSPDRSVFHRIVERLTEKFGVVDMIGPWMPFDRTDYYTAEMGWPLHRRMMAFSKLMDPGRLPEVKQVCHDMEGAFMTGTRRLVNIDPGYLNRARFVLATGKDFTHRMYVGDGVYADLTLVWQAGQFAPLPWTYPDYRQPEMLAFLDRARNRYLAALAGDGTVAAAVKETP